MPIDKKILILLPLCGIFILLSHFIYKDNTFLYDDASLSLGYLGATNAECPNRAEIILRNDSPTLVLNLFGNCIPILHTERTSALAFNIVHLLSKVFSKTSSLIIYKAFFSLLLLLLYLKFSVRLSQELGIDSILTTLLFFFSPYFFFIFEPYLVEKMIPPAVLLIHLLLFSKKEHSYLIAGAISSLFLFLIKLTFLFDLFPIWILHSFYFKKSSKDLKKYLTGFIIGLLPVLIFNFILFPNKWIYLATDITSFSNSLFDNIPNFLELIFIPSSFYINGLFFLPNYTELTEYIPLVALSLSLIISTTYSIKRKNFFLPYLLISFLICFLASYLSIMSKAKNVSVLYISTIGLYIPIIINFGFTRFKEIQIIKKIALPIQALMIILFFYTLIFEVPNFEILSGSSTRDYKKTAKVLNEKKVETLFVDHFEELNFKFFSPNSKLRFTKNFDEINSRSQNFAILSDQFEEHKPQIKLKELGKNFLIENIMINKNQKVELLIFLRKN